MNPERLAEIKARAEAYQQATPRYRPHLQMALEKHATEDIPDLLAALEQQDKRIAEFEAGALLAAQHEERALGGVGDEHLEGYLLAFRQTGLLNDMEYEGWKARLERCPGPLGGGQQWCAYCGTVGDAGYSLMHPPEVAS